jgi:hypothetical protein
MKTLTRLLTFLAPFRRRIALAVFLGSIMIASSIGLFGMAAYLIAAAALGPLLVFLSIPIYLVQTMGVVRAASRYSERLLCQHPRRLRHRLWLVRRHHHLQRCLLRRHPLQLRGRLLGPRPLHLRQPERHRHDRLRRQVHPRRRVLLLRQVRLLS